MSVVVRRGSAAILFNIDDKGSKTTIKLMPQQDDFMMG
jgi:hypothetical protein